MFSGGIEKQHRVKVNIGKIHYYFQVNSRTTATIGNSYIESKDVFW